MSYDKDGPSWKMQATILQVHRWQSVSISPNRNHPGSCLVQYHPVGSFSKSLFCGFLQFGGIFLNILARWSSVLLNWEPRPYVSTFIHSFICNINNPGQTFCDTAFHSCGQMVFVFTPPPQYNFDTDITGQSPVDETIKGTGSGLGICSGTRRKT